MNATIRILMIEDNPADAAGLKKQLQTSQTAAVDLTHAMTLADGLLQLRTGNFDVLLLDLNLPDSKERETIQQVTEHAPNLPIVILTVSNNEALAVEALNKGVQDYFIKGQVDEPLLARAIRHAIERKRVELALRESERQLRGTFENNAIAIAHMDAQGRVIRVNQKLCDLIGYSREEFLQSNFQDKTYPPDLAQDVVMFDKLMRGEHASHSIEKRYVRADGSLIWVRVTRTLQQHNGEPVYCISFVEDITDRKLAETKLAQMAAELQRSNTDLEQFAYVASHDLQEPLRMVRGYLELLERRLADKLDNSTREFMAFAADGAARMQALISDLLAYSRVGREGKDFAQVDMNESLRHAIAGLAAGIQETGAKISSEPLPKVKAEAALMPRLFQNLLGNAIKYQRPGQTPEIQISARRDANAWLFGVRDNGIGIDPAQHDRIFMVFQRLHSRQEYSGTGIGLAICKRIVEYHGGRIWVESKPGEGATFYFTLPDRD